jgi:plasmid stability protein
MAQLLIRNLEDDIKKRIAARARRHGRSTEAEAREILRAAAFAAPRKTLPLGQRLRQLFADIGTDLPIEKLRGKTRPARFE